MSVSRIKKFRNQEELHMFQLGLQTTWYTKGSFLLNRPYIQILNSNLSKRELHEFDSSYISNVLIINSNLGSWNIMMNLYPMNWPIRDVVHFQIFYSVNSWEGDPSDFIPAVFLPFCLLLPFRSCLARFLFALRCFGFIWFLCLLDFSLVFCWRVWIVTEFVRRNVLEKLPPQTEPNKPEVESAHCKSK